MFRETRSSCTYAATDYLRLGYRSIYVCKFCLSPTRRGSDDAVRFFQHAVHDQLTQPAPAPPLILLISSYHHWATSAGSCTTSELALLSRLLCLSGDESASRACTESVTPILTAVPPSIQYQLWLRTLDQPRCRPYPNHFFRLGLLIGLVCCALLRSVLPRSRVLEAPSLTA